MKKALVALASLAAAICVGLSAGQGTAKSSLWLCEPGYYYAGYSHGNPAVGTSYTYGVKATSDTANGGDSHNAIWVGVSQFDDQGDPVAWIQAGILNGGLGPAVYIEDKAVGSNAHIAYSAPATYGTVYSARLTRLGTTLWQMSINGVQTSETVNDTTGVDLTGEILNSTKTPVCNSINYSIVNSSWPTSSMNGPGSSGPESPVPYHVTGITSNGFSVTGPS